MYEEVNSRKPTHIESKTDELEFDEEEFALLPNYLDIVSRVRSIVSYFSRSGLASDTLRKLCEQKGIKYLSLNIDCVTRWSSCYDMLVKFVKMLQPIEDAFMILEKDLLIDKNEIDFIKVIIYKNIMNIIKN